MSSTRLVTAAQMLVRACFVVLLVLGVLFWTGNADSLRIVHILAGILLVLGVWTIAAIALARGVRREVAAAALLWGLLTAVFGLTQERILPGAGHWVVQVAHLLVGVLAIALAEMLAAQLRRGAATESL